MNKIVIGFICIASLFFSACLKNNRSGCDYDACSLVAPDSEVQQVQAYVTANNITAVKHCSGLYYQIQAEGSGAETTPCSTVTINYKGYLTNGAVFDQTTAPVSFSLIDLIQGWKKGLPLIKKGGKIKLIIPPSLAYGSTPRTGIPANSVLVFDIELLGVY
ncbi:MAG: FKBP-type peptidyl-prolyl cis-trans isomerase [Williamsia sp.]|nr:FKBP-type peptidyl-prolyl cis-trans isomerase [Williamsia sp.]